MITVIKNVNLPQWFQVTFTGTSMWRSRRAQTSGMLLCFERETDPLPPEQASYIVADVPLVFNLASFFY